MYATRVTIKYQSGTVERVICRGDGNVWRSIDTGDWISKDAPSIVSVELGRLEFVPAQPPTDFTPADDPKPTASDAREANARLGII